MSSIDLAQLKSQPWYLDGSRQQAENALAAEEAGSFIIRPSSQPNCLALSHKVSTGSIGHALIHNTPQGYRLEQTQNAFPSLELLVLSIKKHFTVNDSMSSFGGAGSSPKAGKPAPAAGGGKSRLSSNQDKINEMSEMFSAHPRESMVAALQLAGGDTEKATELMLSEELYTHSQDSEQNQALSQMIAATVVELGPKIVELRDAVNAIATFQELKAKVSLGKAVADIKRALAAYPATSKRPKPAELPAGKDGTTQQQLVRFKNTIAVSVWEILRKLDGIGSRVQANKLPADRLQQIAASLKAVRETLDAVQVPAPAPSPNVPRRGPKSDEEFYIDVSEIQKEKEIGKGAYGKVYKGKFRGRTVAIKTIMVKDDKELVLIRREISLLRECDHPNIVELLGVSKEGDALLLVTEFVDRGELYKVLLDESIEMDWPLRLKVAQDVASGLAHVHSKNLIHRDIKSENLLVNSNWDVKLCDFGFARAVSHGLHRYTICVPEEHEILTNRGFMDLETYKAHAARDATLRVAGYDDTRQQLVYELPQRLIENKRGAQQLVELTAEHAWSESDDDADDSKCSLSSSSGVSLLVTPDHKLYGSVGKRAALSDAALGDVRFGKLDARRVLDAARDDAASVAFRQLAGAAGGVGGTAKCALPPALAAALRVAAPRDVERFCEVYGFWLGSGARLAHATDDDTALLFEWRSAADGEWLARALAQLDVERVPGAHDDSLLVSDAAWLDALASAHVDTMDVDAMDVEGATCNPLRCAEWLWSLDSVALRAFVSGAARGSDGDVADDGECGAVRNASALLRDELVRVCLLAGYTAHFEWRTGAWNVAFASARAAPQLFAPTLEASRGEIRERAYDGRTWCFTMPSGFLWTRRVLKDASGVVRKASRPLLTGNCGSMYFNAPELLLGKPYDAKADVFAYGIFLCELVTRGSINLVRRKETAFGLDVKALEQHIPKDCPPLFWKVAFCACSYSPQRRPSMRQIEKMLLKIRSKSENKIKGPLHLPPLSK